jgi:hypothetical protein
MCRIALQLQDIDAQDTAKRLTNYALIFVTSIALGCLAFLSTLANINKPGMATDIDVLHAQRAARSPKRVVCCPLQPAQARYNYAAKFRHCSSMVPSCSLAHRQSALDSSTHLVRSLSRIPVCDCHTTVHQRGRVPGELRASTEAPAFASHRRTH